MSEGRWLPLFSVPKEEILAIGKEACEVISAETPPQGTIALVAADGEFVVQSFTGSSPPPTAEPTVWLWSEPIRKMPASSPHPTIMYMEVSASLAEVKGSEVQQDRDALLVATVLSSSVFLHPVLNGLENEQLLRWSRLSQILEMAVDKPDDARGAADFIARQLPTLIYLFEPEATQSTSEIKQKASDEKTPPNNRRSSAAGRRESKMGRNAGKQSPRQRMMKFLTDEKGFGDDLTKRNHVRMLVRELFGRREACEGLLPGMNLDDVGIGVVREKTLETALPKTVHGMAVSGPMLSKMCQSIVNDLSQKRPASIESSAQAALASLADSAHGFAVAAWETATDTNGLTASKLSLLEVESALDSSISEAEKLYAEFCPNGDLIPLRNELAPRAAELRKANMERCDEAAQVIARDLIADTLKAAREIGDAVDGDVVDFQEGGSVKEQPGAILLRQVRQQEARAARLKQALEDLVSQYSNTARGAGKWGKLAEANSDVGLLEVIAEPAGEAAKNLKQLRDLIDKDIRETTENVQNAQGFVKNHEIKQVETRAQRESELSFTMMEAESKRMKVVTATDKLDMKIEEVDQKIERENRRQRASLKRQFEKLDLARKDIGDLNTQLADMQNHSVTQANAAAAAPDQSALLQQHQYLALSREKQLLVTYCETLQDNLDFVQRELDSKQNEVHEVEYQWAEARAKATDLHDRVETTVVQRDDLEELILKLKLYALGGASAVTSGQPPHNKSLPKELRRELSQHEVRALEEIFGH